MANEVIHYLITTSSGTYLDCTLGEGGHAELILSKVGHDGKLIGIDWDHQAIIVAQERLEKFGERAIIVKENFINLEQVIHRFNIDKVDGILFDLGMSNLQISSPERGFSFLTPGPLDMRMNSSGELTAGRLVNSLSESELNKIFWIYGEERFAKRITHAIVQRRKIRPLETTQDLADLVCRVILNGSTLKRYILRHAFSKH